MKKMSDFTIEEQRQWLAWMQANAERHGKETKRYETDEQRRAALARIKKGLERTTGLIDNPEVTGKEVLPIPDITMEQFNFWLYRRITKQQKEAKPIPYKTSDPDFITFTLQQPEVVSHKDFGYMLLRVGMTQNYENSQGNDIMQDSHPVYSFEAEQLGKEKPRLLVTGYYFKKHSTLKALFYEIWDQIINEFGARDSEPIKESKPAKPKERKLPSYISALRTYISQKAEDDDYLPLDYFCRKYDVTSRSVTVLTQLAKETKKLCL